MDETLAILILEDRKADMELTRRAVIKAYPNASFTHAMNKEEFLERLEWIKYDLVLADYYLPGYNGLEALLHLRHNKPYLPFIFVTGALDSEESAANSILDGANGYVLKENLKALPDQIRKAITWGRRMQEQREDQEQKLRSRRIKLQKVAGLLASAPDFPQKSAAIDLLSQLTDK